MTSDDLCLKFDMQERQRPECQRLALRAKAKALRTPVQLSD